MAERITLKDQCDEIYSHVAGRVSKLQGMYLSDSTRGKAARNLAVLRRGVTREPGSIPDLWGIEFDGLPTSLIGKGDKPSAGETAVHLSLALYAVHQQSQNQGMHKSGKENDMGAAVRRMVHFDRSSESLEDGQLPRRFAAMSTAETIDELAHHARQLVHQLRDKSIPIDYGRLARQLFEFQIPSKRDGVRLEWGRAYAQTKNTIDMQNASDNQD